jgi:hypothetical protein
MIVRVLSKERFDDKMGENAYSYYLKNTGPHR